MNAEKKKILMEIFDIVTEINGEEDGKVGNMCVFLHISPHVASIEIEVCPNGWVSGELGKRYESKTNVGVNEAYFNDVSLTEMLHRLKALKSVKRAGEARIDRAS